MPALQFSAAVLSGLLNGNQADTAGKGTDIAGKKSGTDQFSSLLDVVGNVGDSQNHSNKKDDTKDPVAAVVDSPVAFRDTVRKDTQRDKVDSYDVASTRTAVLRPKDKINQDTPAGDSVKKTSSPQATKSASDAPPASDKVDDSSNAGNTNNPDNSKAKNSQHADNLTNLLDIISQLLAGAGNVPAQNVPATQASTDVSTNTVNAQKATDPLAVFTDLKDNLAKLQQFLQTANAQNTPLTDAQTAALTAINSALQNDLGALQNLFPQGITADDQKTLLAQIQQTAGVQDVTASSGQTDFKSLLENDIGLIKDALQKLSDNSANQSVKLVVNKETQAQVQFASKVSEPTDLPTQPREDNRALPAVFTTVVAKTAAEQALNQNPQLQNNQNILPAAVTVQAAADGAKSETNSGGNSGQGGNPGAQFSIGGINQLSAKNADSVSNSQFSNLLNRTTQTPVAEQVAFQVKTAIGSGNSKITIQLHPEDLGKLDITLDVDAKGKTGVTITADNKQTLDMLQRDSQGLQKALADAGLKTDSGSLSFNLRGGEQQGQGQNQSQAASQYKKSQPDELQPEEINITSIASVTRSYVINLPEGLNIKI